MTEPATRLPDVERGDLPVDLDDARICYWKDAAGDWWIYLPRAGVGHLVKHDVTEHEDGTITVSPSIAIGKPRQAGWIRHGFLERGAWREV